MTDSPVTSDNDKPITSAQRKTMRSRLYGVADSAVAELGLTREEYQTLWTHPSLKEDMIAFVREHAGIDLRYEFLIDLGEIVVPSNYVHETRLDLFGTANPVLNCCNEYITSANWAKASTRLEPGRRLHVTAYCFKEGAVVTSPEILDFLRKKRSVLTGAHGNSLVWEQKRDLLPGGKWYLSFDEKDALGVNARGEHVVSFLHIRYWGGDFRFGLTDFEDLAPLGILAVFVFNDVSLEV